MSELDLRAANNWPEQPRRGPTAWTLGELVGIATRAGWFANRGLATADLGDAVDALNYIRKCSLHPAAYVRESAYIPGEREFACCFGVLLAADEALEDVVRALPDAPVSV
jgi:hypothetical protein